MSYLVYTISEASVKNAKTHRLDPLAALAPYIDAKHAVAPPFAFAGQTVNSDDVAQGGLDRPAFYVYPVERCGTMWVGTNLWGFGRWRA